MSSTISTGAGASPAVCVAAAGAGHHATCRIRCCSSWLNVPAAAARCLVRGPAACVGVFVVTAALCSVLCAL